MAKASNILNVCHFAELYSGVESKMWETKDKSLFYFSHRSCSSLQQLHKVKDHDCLHSLLILIALSDQTAAGTHIMLFPPASTSYPHRNLMGIHV